jgi:hypothetical protein
LSYPVSFACVDVTSDFFKDGYGEGILAMLTNGASEVRPGLASLSTGRGGIEEMIAKSIVHRPRGLPDVRSQRRSRYRRYRSHPTACDSRSSSVNSFYRSSTLVRGSAFPICDTIHCDTIHCDTTHSQLYEDWLCRLFTLSAIRWR